MRKLTALWLAAIFVFLIILGVKLRRPETTWGIASNLCIDCMGLKSKIKN
ncbi:MAG: hypothetical protein ABIH68_00850 [bacterium]